MFSAKKIKNLQLYILRVFQLDFRWFQLFCEISTKIQLELSTIKRASFKKYTYFKTKTLENLENKANLALVPPSLPP